jgi:hypothetical protein
MYRYPTIFRDKLSFYINKKYAENIGNYFGRDGFVELPD